MNSTPAFSNAEINAYTVVEWALIMPCLVSKRLMVGKDTPDAAARSFCSHLISARAAFINSLVSMLAGFRCYRHHMIPKVLTEGAS